MKRFFPLLAFSVAAAFATSAGAACHWEWFCNGDGVCKQMPLCDSIYEKPPPKPDSQPPVPPPISVRPVRIPGAMGSLTCEHIMRQSPSGKWTWVETCYCSDPARAADTSAPFANIVRCEGR
jgi:hypothetical protein